MYKMRMRRVCGQLITVSDHVIKQLRAAALEAQVDLCWIPHGLLSLDPLTFIYSCRDIK